jgi:hypothetical protein
VHVELRIAELYEPRPMAWLGHKKARVVRNAGVRVEPSPTPGQIFPGHVFL